MTNLASDLQSTVMNNQDATAIDAGSELSFSRLWSLTDRFAGGLRDHDIDTGDRVGICVNDPTVLLTAVYGTLRNGCVPVVFSPDLFDSTVAEGLDEVNAPIIVVDDRSPVSLISLSDSMRCIVTVDMDTYFGVAYESFLDNNGINSAGARTGIDLVERAEDDTALIAHGRLDGETTIRRYTHSRIREAIADDEFHPVAAGIRHLNCLQPSEPVSCLYEATTTLLNGGCYVHLGEWSPERVRAKLVDDTTDHVSLTPAQCADLESQGCDPTAQPITVVEPVMRPESDACDGSPADGISKTTPLSMTEP